MLPGLSLSRTPPATQIRNALTKRHDTDTASFAFGNDLQTIATHRDPQFYSWGKSISGMCSCYVYRAIKKGERGNPSRHPASGEVAPSLITRFLGRDAPAFRTKVAEGAPPLTIPNHPNLISVSRYVLPVSQRNAAMQGCKNKRKHPGHFCRYCPSPSTIYPERNRAPEGIAVNPYSYSSTRQPNGWEMNLGSVSTAITKHPPQRSVDPYKHTPLWRFRTSEQTPVSTIKTWVGLLGRLWDGALNSSCSFVHEPAKDELGKPSNRPVSGGGAGSDCLGFF